MRLMKKTIYTYTAEDIKTLASLWNDKSLTLPSIAHTMKKSYKETESIYQRAKTTGMLKARHNKVKGRARSKSKVRSMTPPNNIIDALVSAIETDSHKLSGKARYAWDLLKTQMGL